MSTKDENVQHVNGGDGNMPKKIDHANMTGLTKEKKELLQKLMGSASSQYLDLNKIRDEANNEQD